MSRAEGVSGGGLGRDSEATAMGPGGQAEGGSTGERSD